MTILLMLLAFAGGFVACWFSKDWLIMSYDGTWNFVHRLEAKAAALKEKL